MRFADCVVTAALALVIAGVDARAQLITNTQAIPRTGKPPVVFVNGYQNDCGGTTFRGTFGTADQVLQSDNRVSIFFDTCSVADHPPIEELG